MLFSGRCWCLVDVDCDRGFASKCAIRGYRVVHAAGDHRVDGWLVIADGWRYCRDSNWHELWTNWQRVGDVWQRWHWLYRDELQRDCGAHDRDVHKCHGCGCRFGVEDNYRQSDERRVDCHCDVHSACCDRAGWHDDDERHDAGDDNGNELRADER